MPAKGPRAPVGVALIVKDGEKTLGPCLDSIRPFVTQIVVAVDERTTDKTRKVARKHGADVIVPVKVSDWHECEQHGRVLAQHFGNARNESFTHLDPALPWWLWIDADDLLTGGEHLAALCAGIPGEAVGCWLRYRYSTINNYAETTTLYDRERILRSSVGWRWEYRVHEVVVPSRANPTWAADDRVQVVHQEGVHRTEASTTRNQLLLEIDWEEQPDNQRTSFYLANGFFASNDMPRAVEWYDKTTKIGTNPWEVWQSFCYLSISCRRLGDLDGAVDAALAAVERIPDYREGYYRLAEAYLDAGEFTKAIGWAEKGLDAADPPRFVFVNPLDTKVNIRTVLADAHGQLGDYAEARQHLEAAYKVAPSESLVAGIRRYAGLEKSARLARAFADLAEGQADERVVALFKDLPSDVKAFEPARDVAIPAMLRLRERRLEGAAFLNLESEEALAGVDQRAAVRAN